MRDKIISGFVVGLLLLFFECYVLKKNPKTIPQEKANITNSYEDIQNVHHNFFYKKYDWTEKWYNRSENFENDFTENRDGTITDNSTGLIWQKSGSDNYMPYNNVPEHIRRLNHRQFDDGYGSWRLPTFEELISFMDPEKQIQWSLH